MAKLTLDETNLTEERAGASKPARPVLWSEAPLEGEMSSLSLRVLTWEARAAIYAAWAHGKHERKCIWNGQHSAEQRRCSINDIFYNLFAKWYQEIGWDFQVNVLPTILLHFLSWRVLIFLHTAWKIFKYYYRSSHYSMSMWLGQVVAEKCF